MYQRTNGKPAFLFFVLSERYDRCNDSKKPKCHDNLSEKKRQAFHLGAYAVQARGNKFRSKFAKIERGIAVVSLVLISNGLMYRDRHGLHRSMGDELGIVTDSDCLLVSSGLSTPIFTLLGKDDFWICHKDFRPKTSPKLVNLSFLRCLGEIESNFVWVYIFTSIVMFCHFFVRVRTYLFVRALLVKTLRRSTREGRPDTLVEVWARSVHSGARCRRSKFFPVGVDKTISRGFLRWLY